MIWRVFRKSSSSSNGSDDASWWTEAEGAADVPTAEIVASLRARMIGRSPDEAERQEEMIDGLERVLALAAEASLPVVSTQHRVIGTDVCHLVTPATLSADLPVPGKIFLTSTRLVFAGGRVQSWPWHRLRDVSRIGRDVVAILGGDDGVRLQCNSYGDAMVARHVARRLARHVR